MKKFVLCMAIVLCATNMAAYLNAEEKQGVESHSESLCYTCRMHKQIKASKPGKCPLCKMNLVSCPEPEASNESNHKHGA